MQERGQDLELAAAAVAAMAAALSAACLPSLRNANQSAV